MSPSARPAEAGLPGADVPPYGNEVAAPPTPSFAAAVAAASQATSERICLNARGNEHDLQRPPPDGIMLAHELVQAAVAEHAVAVLVDVNAV